MASKAKTVAAKAKPLSLEELTEQKVAAGLARAQAETVAKRQLARDESGIDIDALKEEEAERLAEANGKPATEEQTQSEA